MPLKQYNEIYINRLKKIKQHYNIEFTPLNTPKRNCTIFGILFMVSDLKNSIFDDLKYYKDIEKGDFYYSKDVKWFLEDEHDRILLENMPDELLTTGMAVAIEGSHIEGGGAFEVIQIIFPNYNIHKKHKNELANNPKAGNRVLIVSNLQVDQNSNIGKLQVILDSVKKMNIDGVLFLGSLVSTKTEIMNYKQKLETLLNNLNCKVYIVPGQTDPTSVLYPQEPIHKQILNYENLHNPDDLLINEYVFLLTSGYNIRDMVKYRRNKLSQLQNEDNEYRMHITNKDVVTKNAKNIDVNADDLLEAMTMVLKCKLTCPTAPDTLKSLPLDSSKFFVEKHYDYFFCGSANEMKVGEYENTIMVTVPDFNKVGLCVLLDMESKKVKIVNVK